MYGTMYATPQTWKGREGWIEGRKAHFWLYSAHCPLTPQSCFWWKYSSGLYISVYCLAISEAAGLTQTYVSFIVDLATLASFTLQEGGRAWE